MNDGRGCKLFSKVNGAYVKSGEDEERYANDIAVEGWSSTKSQKQDGRKLGC